KIESNYELPEVKNSIHSGSFNTNIGLVYKALNDFEKAEIHLKKALEICEQDNQDKIKCIVPLENLGDLYFAQKDDSNAVTYYKQSWDLQQNPTQYDPYLVKLTQNLLASNTYLNQPDEVKKYCTFLWDYIKTYKKEELSTEFNKSTRFFKEANQPELRLFALEKQAVFLQSTYPLHQDYPRVLHNLGMLHKERKQYKEALDYYDLAIATITKIQGPESAELLLPLQSAIDLLSLNSNQQKALEYSAIRDKIIQKQSGNLSDDYYESQLEQAQLMLHAGQLDKALQVLDKNHDFFQAQKEKNLLLYVDYLVTKANVYTVLQQYDKSAPLLAEGYELTFDKQELAVFFMSITMSISNFFEMALDYQSAANLLNSGIGILKEYPLDRGAIELMFARLAAVYTNMEEYESAKEIYTGIIPVLEDVLGKDQYKVFETKNNYALLLAKTKKHQEAETIFYELEKIAADKKLKGADRYTVYNNLGNVLEGQNKYEEATAYYKKFIDLYLDEIEGVFTFLSEKEKENYLIGVSQHYHYLMNFYHSLPNKNLFVDDIFRLNSTFKGMILQSSVDIKKKWKSLNNPESVTLLETWQQQQALKNAYLFEGDNDKAEEVQQVLDGLEREMSIKIPDYHSQSLLSNITQKELRDQLKPNEVIVDFIQFEIGDVWSGWENDQQYSAFVISPKSKELVYVPLFKQSQLDSILKQDVKDTKVNNLYRGSVGVGNNNQNYGKKLYEALWQPLESYIPETSTVYVIPAGVLHQLALAAIPLDENTVLMEKYQLVQRNDYKGILNSVPILKPSSYEFDLFGGIDYNASINNKQTPSNNTAQAWNYLPGTLEEVQLLKDLIPSKTQKVLTASQATEQAFYNSTQTPTPKVLHIATHGYFFAKPPKNKDELFTVNPLEKAENPLLRSGLILAGGNHAWTGAKPEALNNDGILSALEVNNMDLSSTDLVVLSACETGLGDISGNEGVFGLQRAFKTAGVKYLLMSLWKVPDAETAEFMQNFYKEWSTKEDLETAFRSTQMLMKTKYPEEPYKWAAFVLVR
ncbi:MAG TPA: CHAT domain-containing tetratricopeptide repeat protein, partial [Flavobacteriaceae bacterium]|nr:CHAT domain-containing tetratricopeptide repeat protein [Flavobacteriaceae bacterium]